MRPDSKVTCVKINELNTSYSDIIFSLSPIKGNDEPVSYNARINLPGLYNIYNALAAASLGHLSGFSPESLVKAMESFECGFGRMKPSKPTVKP